MVHKEEKQWINT